MDRPRILIRRESYAGATAMVRAAVDANRSGKAVFVTHDFDPSYYGRLWAQMSAGGLRVEWLDDDHFLAEVQS